mmetsp:Transcript_66706/g.132178  ORF Transcript_66706/g.132178 Transcript_66706/m.132178 type:complete len:200 (-) Transcript_66706:152-751(-)
MRDHIPAPHLLLGELRGGINARDHHTGALRWHLGMGSKRAVLAALHLEAELTESCVRTVPLDVSKEVHDDLGRDDVAYVLRLAVLERLECHTHALVRVVEGWPAAVARVDGGIYLDCKKLTAAVHILLHVDARDHTLRDGEIVASYREADDRGHVLERRQGVRQPDRQDVRPKALIMHSQQRQIALSADGDHLRNVLGG